ncbi:MAG: hypothetical protein ACK5KU_04170 [Beutenbergiaceae bacterium]
MDQRRGARAVPERAAAHQRSKRGESAAGHVGGPRGLGRQRFIDDIVIIGSGRILSQTSLDQLPAGTDLEAFYLSTLHTATDQEAQS